jgi:hypothetical protein
MMNDVAQWINLFIGNNESKASYLQMKVKDLLDPSFSFLLHRDHGFDSMAYLLVWNKETKQVELLTLLSGCECKISTNPSRFSLQSSQHRPIPEPAIGLVVLKCLEAEDRYDLVIGVRGDVISSANGNYFNPFSILSFN